jgi:hypothetical protein
VPTPSATSSRTNSAMSVLSVEVVVSTPLDHRWFRSTSVVPLDRRVVPLERP